MEYVRTFPRRRKGIACSCNIRFDIEFGWKSNSEVWRSYQWLWLLRNVIATNVSTLQQIRVGPSRVFVIFYKIGHKFGFIISQLAYTIVIPVSHVIAEGNAPHANGAGAQPVNAGHVKIAVRQRLDYRRNSKVHRAFSGIKVKACLVYHNWLFGYKINQILILSKCLVQRMIFGRKLRTIVISLQLDVGLHVSALLVRHGTIYSDGRILQR